MRPLCYSSKQHSQIRPPVELAIEDEAQIFDLGTQRESCLAFAKRGEIRNFTSSCEKNLIGLRMLDRQSKNPYISPDLLGIFETFFFGTFLSYIFCGIPFCFLG